MSQYANYYMRIWLETLSHSHCSVPSKQNFTDNVIYTSGKKITKSDDCIKRYTQQNNIDNSLERKITENDNHSASNN